jgi:CrcB protein
MTKALLLIFGGGIGTLLRYLVSGLGYRYFDGTFPLGTLFVNLIGSLLIGFLWGIFEIVNISPNVRLFVFIGVLGGFTTFSTLTLESFNLFKDGEIKFAITNILANNVLGIALVFVGFAIARYLITLIR